MPGKPSPTKSQPLVVEDGGQLWLLLDLLERHDEYVVFTGIDGSRRLDLLQDGDTFEWAGRMFEVWGFDRKRGRAWVGVVPIDTKPAGLQGDPREAWRRSA